jgi:hypothetical protein
VRFSVSKTHVIKAWLSGGKAPCFLAEQIGVAVTQYALASSLDRDIGCRI